VRECVSAGNETWWRKKDASFTIFLIHSQGKGFVIWGARVKKQKPGGAREHTEKRLLRFNDDIRGYSWIL